MAYSSINNSVQIIKEDSFGSGSGANVFFGFLQKYSHTSDTHTTQVWSLDGTPKPNINIDGVMEYSASLDWFVTDGRELECVFGNLSDDGNGNATLTIANTLPSYAVRSFEGDTNLLFKGVKFSKAIIEIAKDDFLTVTADLIGRELVEDATQVTPAVPTTPPFFFTDGYVSIDGENYAGIDHLSIELDRHATAYRGLEQVGAGEKRLISEIVEGVVSIAFDGSMTARKSVIEKLFGGSSLVDIRSDSSIVLNFANGTNTLQITLTGARFTARKKDEDTQAEVVLVEFDGVALDITASVTY